ncbi:hypothetical protein BGY98DRAFT_280881 [Russula aff. rugulosa BPL654]|nr:hypothetical protein BGY98DRAFT_280881 [Russula aff. rugulosa BPL654]
MFFFTKFLENLRYAQGAGVGARRAPTLAPAQLPVGVGTFSFESLSESRSATGITTLTRMPRCCPRLVCSMREVPLPPELQKASESPWTMLCEDALLAFEYVPNGFEISSGCLHIRFDRGARVTQLGEHRHLFITTIYRIIICHNSAFFLPPPRNIQIPFRNITSRFLFVCV